MNPNLTFVLISSPNDLIVVDTIKSIQAVGRVILVDGGNRKSAQASSDPCLNLAEVAKNFACEYIFNRYEYSAQQYNFGIKLVRTKWTFVIDSDETLSPELSNWLSNSEFEGTADYFYVKRINYFLGKRVKHGQFRPDWNVRLFRTNACQYEDRAVHARMITSGKKSEAPGYMNHFTVQSVDLFFLKMVEFTNLEAKSRINGSSSNEFKARLRHLLQNLPAQSFLRFVYSYIYLRGFLDGRLGYLLARSASFYETMVAIRNISEDD